MFKNKKSFIGVLFILAFFGLGTTYFFTNYKIVLPPKLAKEVPDTYWEWEAHLTPSEVTDMFSEKKIIQLGRGPHYKRNEAAALRFVDEIDYVRPESECFDCEILNFDIPSEHQPYNLDKAFYDKDKNLYFSFHDGHYSEFFFYKNNQLITSIFTNSFRADMPLWNLGLIDGELTFEYAGMKWSDEERYEMWIREGCLNIKDQIKSCMEKNEEDSNEECSSVNEFLNYCQESERKGQGFFMDIYYQGEFMNEKFDLEGSKELFIYKNKIGFIEQEGDQYLIWFNGQKVSDGFDSIRTHACCATIAFPFSVYENGILHFGAARNDVYYNVEINLNHFL